MQNTKPRDVGVLLFPSFSMHCLANAVEPLRAANQLSGQTLYRWQYLSLDGDEVVSSSGLPVRPAMRLGAHEGGSMLLMMPSYGYRGFCDVATLRALRSAATRFETVIGLDCGAWLMAAAGLLEGRRATIHWDERTSFSETFPEIEVLDDRHVIDGNRITCGGASTSFELMLDLIQRDHGAMLRVEVGALFMLGSHIAANPPVSQRSGIARIDRAVAIMRRHIEDPLPIARVADAAGMGARRLETVFRDGLGVSPRAVYKSIRLAEARRLLLHSGFSIAEIAGRCGYQDASAMSRAFRAEFGMSPSDVRRSAM